MFKSIVPLDAPKELLTIECDGITLSHPEIELDGFWFVARWMFDGDEDIRGFCIADGDSEGFPFPNDWDAADTLDNILMHLEKAINRRIADDGFNKPIPVIAWDAWVETNVWADAKKLQDICNAANAD